MSTLLRVLSFQSSKFTTEERTVVVIDELYDNRNIVDDFLNFKCCWVAAVEAGQVENFIPKTA